jgi:hypothetical protein
MDAITGAQSQNRTMPPIPQMSEVMASPLLGRTGAYPAAGYADVAGYPGAVEYPGPAAYPGAVEYPGAAE